MEKGIDIYARNQNGSNLLHIAVKNNNMPAKNNGITAVGIAAYKGNV
jgi:ankyrin repeat protein